MNSNMRFCLSNSIIIISAYDSGFQWSIPLMPCRAVSILTDNPASYPPLPAPMFHLQDSTTASAHTAVHPRADPGRRQSPSWCPHTHQYACRCRYQCPQAAQGMLHVRCFLLAAYRKDSQTKSCKRSFSLNRALILRLRCRHRSR